MKNKYLVPILSCFFIIAILIYLANLYHYAKDCHGYIVADWLIGFQGGFVRRGLCGYLIILTTDFLDLQPNLAVMFIQIVFYLSYMFLFFFLIKRKKIDLWFIILLLSPATLLFPIWDVAAVGRKEIILFTLFGLYLHCLNRDKFRPPFMIFLFSMALFLATLFHELVFFYTPYFVLAGYLHATSRKNPFHLPTFLFLILGSFVAIVPLFFFGRSINGPVICESLMERGLDARVCLGILTVPTEYSISYVFQQVNSAGYFWCYSIAFILGTIPFILFVNYSVAGAVTLKKFFLTFFFLFLFSSPLFILAFDWGRWINIHFMMLLFTATLLLKDKWELGQTPVSWADQRVIVPHLWKSETVLQKLSASAFFLILSFSYVVFWQMKHFDFFPVFYLERVETFTSEIQKSLVIVEELIALAREHLE